MLSDTDTHSSFSCHVNHRYAGYFTQEGYGSGRTGVNFDYEYFVVTNDVLNVDHTLNFQAQCHFIGIFNDSFNYRFGQADGRIYSDGVAGVYARTFNVFHDTGNEHVVAITDSINLYFPALQVVVNQNRMLLGSLYCVGHVVSQFVVIVNDFHCTTAQYIGRTNHYRVANICCCPQCAFGIEDSVSFRTRNVAIGKELFKTFTVFCTVNAVYAAAKDFYTAFSQGASQVNCSLTTELYNNAFRLFLFDYVEHIFQGQRFKVQLIGNVEVSGNSFRVVVDDDGFVAHFAQRPYGVYGAVVKFYALTNADRTGAKHYNFLSIAYGNFVFVFVGGIVVRSCSFKLCSAGIYNFICGQDVVFLTHCTNFKSILANKLTNYRVSKAHLFSLQQQCRCKLFVFEGCFHINNVGNFMEEPFIHFGNVINVINGYTTADSFCDNKEAFVVNTFNAFFNFVVA